MSVVIPLCLIPLAGREAFAAPPRQLCQSAASGFLIIFYDCVFTQYIYIPVVPHKAVAQVSKIGKL